MEAGRQVPGVARDKRAPSCTSTSTATRCSPEQLAEFVWGLAVSGHPFLWSIRADLVHDSGSALVELPPALEARTARRCPVTTWCSQEQMLRHPTIGGFLTSGTRCAVGVQLDVEVRMEAEAASHFHFNKRSLKI